MYQCKHFSPQELVPPEVFEELKYSQWRIWSLFDDRALMGLDILWEHLSELAGKEVKITVNTWLWGGALTRCGYRPPPPRDGESKYGQHPRGGAFDLHVDLFTPEQVRQEILTHKEKFSPYFRCLEKDTDTWTHVAMSNYGEDPKEIYLINPH